MSEKLDGATRFARAAAELGVEVDPVRYPAGTRTAADAAAAIGCEVAQIVKSLVLIGPDGPIVALTAGHNRVDLDHLAGFVCGPVRMANANEAREATGYSIGGTPPFGHPAPITTLIDPSLLGHEVVYGAAGAADSCFPISPQELLRVTSAAPAAFVEG